MSPARSQGSPRQVTPRRQRPRKTSSVGSPAYSNATGRLSTMIQEYREMNMGSFVLSPLVRKSMLTDNTDIEEPRRKSWWKNLNENSRDVMEVLEDNKVVEPNNIIEELDIEVLSQEKKNYTLDLPESSDNESINSIVIPQRKFFTEKENKEKKYDQFGTRDTLGKLHKTNATAAGEKTVSTATKELFQNKPRSKPIFPAALLDISLDKTTGDKTLTAEQPKGQVRDIFCKSRGTKRKNMFANFIVSESEDEIPEIQPKIFGFQKNSNAKRRPSSRGIRDSSPTSMNSDLDMELDSWKLIPSSTMVENQLEAIMSVNEGQEVEKTTRVAEKDTEQSNREAVMNQDENVEVENINKSKGSHNQTKELENNLSSHHTQEVEHEGDHQEDENDVNINNKKQNVEVQETGSKNDLNKSQEDQIISQEMEKHKSDEQEDENAGNNEHEEKNENLEVENYEIERENDLNESQKEQFQELQNVGKADQNKSQKMKNLNTHQQDEYDDNNEDEERDEIETENQGVERKNAFIENQNEQKKSQQIQDERHEERNKSQEIEDKNPEEQNETEKQENESEADNEINENNDSQEVMNKSEDEPQNISQEEMGSNVSKVVHDQEMECDDENEAEEATVIESDQENENETKNETQEVENDSDNEQLNISQEDMELNISEEDEDQELKYDDENEVEDEAAVESDQNDNQENESEVENEVEENNETQEVESESDDEHQNISQEEMGPEINEEVDDQETECDDENEATAVESDQNDNEAIDSDEEAENDQNYDEDHDNQEQNNDEIDETPNVSHDTTGRKRKKKDDSPEAVLHDKTNKIDSFTVHGRNTSIRKTKSTIGNLNTTPRLAPARESTRFSDGIKNSSAEGSGWDSHRTTRKTLRQTFGKDFTPRMSLRAMVLEKSTKRQTLPNDITSVTSKFPQANSTELPEDSAHHDADLVTINDEPQESDHEVSRRTRQTTLEMYLQKIKEQNTEKRVKMEEAVRSSLKAPPRDPFKVPAKPMFPRRPITKNTKPKRTPLSELKYLPEEVIEDMKYKPPKRFQPRDAPWATKRLYKYFETKLEPKYNYKARVRSEKLMETLYQFTKEARRNRVASTDSIDVLKHEFARLDIVKTHFEFYEFFHQFMPREIRIKVIPDVVNDMPLPRHGVFADILRGNTA